MKVIFELLLEKKPRNYLFSIKTKYEISSDHLFFSISLLVFLFRFCSSFPLCPRVELSQSAFFSSHFYLLPRCCNSRYYFHYRRLFHISCECPYLAHNPSQRNTFPASAKEGKTEGDVNFVVFSCSSSSSLSCPFARRLVCSASSIRLPLSSSCLFLFLFQAEIIAYQRFYFSCSENAHFLYPIATLCNRHFFYIYSLIICLQSNRYTFPRLKLTVFTLFQSDNSKIEMFHNNFLN